VNKKDYTWPKEEITGADVRARRQPEDWVVNEIVGGAGEDPELATTSR